jgi:hypothetical protein
MKWYLCVAVAALTGTIALAGDPAPSQTSTNQDRRHGRRQLTEEQRAELEQRLNDTWTKLSLREKQQVLRLNQALRQIPPEEQKFIHERIERFMNMSPEERQRMRENAKVWKQMTPEQREQARQKFQQKRHEYIEKWRQEHPGEEPPPFPFHRHLPPSTKESESVTNQQPQQTQ